MPPIKVVLFPKNTLTFHLTPTNPDGTLQLARTTIVVNDSYLTLLELQNEFSKLDHKEQCNFLVAMLVEKL